MSSRKDKGHYGRAWNRMRLEMIESTPYCYLCGEWVDKNLHWMDDGAPQIHLVVPRAKGGSWRDRSNLRVTHRKCNRRQGDNWDGTVNHSHRDDTASWVFDEQP